MMAPIRPAASAYEAQLKIRREGEERSAAQQDLSTKKSSVHQENQREFENLFHSRHANL